MISNIEQRSILCGNISICYEFHSGEASENLSVKNDKNFCRTCTGFGSRVPVSMILWESVRYTGVWPF